MMWLEIAQIITNLDIVYLRLILVQLCESELSILIPGIMYRKNPTRAASH